MAVHGASHGIATTAAVAIFLVIAVVSRLSHRIDAFSVVPSVAVKKRTSQRSDVRLSGPCRWGKQSLSSSFGATRLKADDRDDVRADAEQAPVKKKKKKKKKKFIINTDLTGTVSIGKGVDEPSVRKNTGSLGVSKKPSRQHRHSTDQPQNTATKLTKKQRQRTANGVIDSSKQTMLSDETTKANEPVQVVEAKRGNKVVTIVRGMTSPIDERKTLLKELKKKLGGGGTLVEGVLELQGAHGDKVVAQLRNKGYKQARKI